jgi:hypothetical protein
VKDPQYLFTRRWATELIDRLREIWQYVQNTAPDLNVYVEAACILAVVDQLAI